MKRMAAILSIWALLLSGIPFFSAAASDAAYILISTPEELAAIANNLAGNYRLKNDITLTASFPLLAPDAAHAFTGSLDGAGYAIAGLRAQISGNGTLSAGLFGYNKGTILNLALTRVDVRVSGTDGYGNAMVYAGAIAGVNEGAIRQCEASGTVSASSATFRAVAGGLAGRNAGTMDRTAAYVYVAATGASEAVAGGLIGENAGTLTNSFSMRTVSAEGSAANTDCYLGGLAGQNGFAGAGSIQYCYSRSALVCTAQSALLGGIAGENAGTVQDCYYLADTAARAAGDSREITGAVSNLSMRQQASFSTFDFVHVWGMYDFPVLQGVRSASDVLLGDVDASGQVTMADIIYLMQIINQKKTDALLKEAADLNRDRRISITDAVLLLRKLAGLS